MAGLRQAGRLAVALAAVLTAAFCIFPSFCASQEEKGWNTSKSTHFIVYYRNAPDDFISELQSSAEDYYKEITEDLGFNRFDFWTWDARARIYVYDDAGSYRKATGQPEWSGGIVFTEQKLIQTFAFAEGFLDSVLPHEISHIVFREFVGFRNADVPLWMDEGVAAFHEKEKYSEAKEFLNKAREQGAFLSLDALSRVKKVQSLDAFSAGVFYNEAFSIVSFLINEYGRDEFVILCRGLRDGKDMRDAFKSAYSFEGLGEMEKAWLASLE